MAKIDFEHGVVDMTHGSGGRAMTDLIEQLFVVEFATKELHKGEDFAAFQVQSGRMVVSTDSHVISPLFFPGGDIGSLAVNGTINDVAMSGANPLYLTCGFIIEQGFPLKELKKIVQSMANAAREAGVKVVAGDTKVVERGKGDGVFITTTGVGAVPEGIDISVSRISPGDKILVSGTLGDHGITVLSFRESLGFHTDLVSDCAALNGLAASMITVVPQIHCLRDPTRGGLAAALCELSDTSGFAIGIQEKSMPIKPQVRSACELLGLDPLHVANEGKLIAICPEEYADQLLHVMKEHPLGRDAAIIGTVLDEGESYVELETNYGTKRLVDWPSGEQLPRIC